MTLPEPKPGLVVHYDYLWTDDAASGQNHGKTRPACLAAATDPSAIPRYVVLLLIAHAQPADNSVGIEVPAHVKQALGLDQAPSWEIVSEHNIDEWPNCGLSPLPGQSDEFASGFIPPSLFSQIKARFLELAGAKKGHGVHR